MKRILQIVGTMDRAGAETMVMSLYRAIDKSEYQFDFVYFTERSCSYDEEIRSLGGTIFRIPEESSRSSLRRTWELYKLIKKNKPFHAVHCHQLFSNAFHLIAAYSAGVRKRIAHSHNTSDINSKTVLGKLYQNFSRKIIGLLSTDYIACGDEAGRFLFPKQSNIIFIPNAVDVNKFLNVRDNKIENFFDNKFITSNTIIISQIGRLMPVKNVEFSIRFAEFIKNKNIDFHLFLVGSGILQDQLKEMVLEKSLNKNITFLGVRSDIEKILGQTDVLLMPSFHEGFPVILVEAQTAGTPALISDNISNEVDLGLKLIEFCSLDTPFKGWLNKINMILDTEKVSARTRHQTLREKGFDIDVSVKLLQGVYDKN